MGSLTIVVNANKAKTNVHPCDKRHTLWRDTTKVRMA